MLSSCRGRLQYTFYLNRFGEGNNIINNGCTNDHVTSSQKIILYFLKKKHFIFVLDNIWTLSFQVRKSNYINLDWKVKLLSLKLEKIFIRIDYAYINIISFCLIFFVSELILDDSFFKGNKDLSFDWLLSFRNGCPQIHSTCILLFNGFSSIFMSTNEE